MDFLVGNFNEGLKYFSSETKESVQDEVVLLTKYLFYKLGIKKDADFQGHQFENIRQSEKFDSENGLTQKQKNLILGLWVFADYLLKKLLRYTKTRNAGIHRVLQAGYTTFDLFNTLLFILGSKYPTLVHRIAKVEFVGRRI